MAIEFDCPRCSATIRVPDAYSGRQGRCPQCNERLLVPLVAVPETAPQIAMLPTAPPTAHAPAAVPGAAFASPPAAVQQFAAPAGAVPQVPTESVLQEAAAGPVAAVPSGAGPPAAGPAAVSVGGLSGAPATATARRGRGKSSRFNRRRPSRALVIGIPVIGFLLLLAILALTIPGGPELQGELRGRLLAEKSLPRTVVPWSDAGVSAEQQQVLQAALSENPETFSSELMVCRVLGTTAGLEIQLTAATGARWCAVNPHEAGQKALALWLKQQRVRLGEQRRSEMTQTLTAWCQDKLRQISGESIAIDAAGARDNGVLNATVDSLGYSVQARAGKRLVRAAAEDDAGWLYFCVPADTQSLVVEGRSHGTSGLLFPGRYDVTFETSAAAAPAGSGQQPPVSESADEPAMEEGSGKEPGNEPGMEPGMEDSGEPAAPKDADANADAEKMQKMDAFGGAMKGMFESKMSE